MNAADVKAKLTAANGRAEKLAKAEVPVVDGIREIYLTAFSRQPSVEELSIAEDFLNKPRTDAQDKPVDPARAKRLAYEDLLWAIVNTKEFLFNH